MISLERRNNDVEDIRDDTEDDDNDHIEDDDDPSSGKSCLFCISRRGPGIPSRREWVFV